MVGVGSCAAMLLGCIRLYCLLICGVLWCAYDMYDGVDDGVVLAMCGTDRAPCALGVQE